MLKFSPKCASRITWCIIGHISLQKLIQWARLVDLVFMIKELCNVRANEASLLQLGSCQVLRTSNSSKAVLLSRIVVSSCYKAEMRIILTLERHLHSNPCSMSHSVEG